MKIQLNKTVKCKTSIEESKRIVERIIELKQLLNQIKSDMHTPSGRLKNGIKQRIQSLEVGITTNQNILNSKADEVEDEIYQQVLYKIQNHVDEVTAKFLDVHHDLAVAIRISLFRDIEEKISRSENPNCYDFPKVTIENKDYFINAYISDRGDGLDGIVIKIHDSKKESGIFTIQKELKLRNDRQIHSYFYHLCKFDLEEFAIECPESYSEISNYDLHSSSFATDNAKSVGLLIHSIGKMMEIMNRDLKLNAFIGMERKMVAQIRRPESLRAIENKSLPTLK